MEVRDVPPGARRSYGDNNHFVLSRRQSKQRVAVAGSQSGEINNRAKGHSPRVSGCWREYHSDGAMIFAWADSVKVRAYKPDLVSLKGIGLKPYIGIS